MNLSFITDIFPDLCKVAKIIPLHKKDDPLFCENYRPISHALINLTEYIKNLLDSGNIVCGVFIDLEKAFDTVNHEILCQKLIYYGF